MSTNLALAAGLLAADTNYRAFYEQLYANGMPGVYNTYTQVIPNQAKQVELDWITRHPVMGKWTGARQYGFLRHYKQTLTFDVYQAALKLKRVDIQYDTTGAIERAISTFLSYNVAAYDKAVSTSFDSASGAGPTGFDAVALFSSAHPQGPSGNQSNIGSGTNLSHAGLVTAIQVMGLWQHENGEPAGARPTMMRIGPNLRVRAQELTNAYRTQTTTNASAFDAGTIVAATAIPSVWEGSMKIVEDPRVTTYYWTLVDESKPGATPMVMLENRAPEPISRVSMTDPARWDEDAFEWALEGDFRPDAGHWLTCYRGTGTA